MMIEAKCKTMCSFLILVVLLTSISNCHYTQTDIACLKSLQRSLSVPFNHLATWNFQNKTEGFICNFIGVECWQPNENKVLNIRLSSMGLKGQFPTGLVNCTSMTGLDLSDNQLYGPLPTDISLYVGYLTSLDLSKNMFSGGIPADFEKSAYLNVLKLDDNQFTGEIPIGIGQLSRLKTFSAAGNRLTGNIPPFVNPQPAENFANNRGLCGPPSAKCKSKKHIHVAIDSRALGLILFIDLLFVIVVVLICSFVCLSCMK